MLRKIAVDMGKFATKAAVYPSHNNVTRLTFRTKLDEGSVGMNSGLIDGNSSHTVSYNGKNYLIGASATNNDLGTDSKATLTHIIAAYTAIALLTDPGDEVIVAIGCPLSFFRNKDAMISYRDAVFPHTGRYDIVVDGQAKYFNLVKTMVLPESSGPIFLNHGKFKDMRVGVIDIGGLNSNGCVFDNAIPIFGTAFTNKLGGFNLVNDLYNTVKIALAKKGISNIEKSQLERDIRQGFCLADEALTRPIIEQAKVDAAKVLYKEAASNNWGVDNMYVTFIGGTSRLLEKELKDAFPHILPDTFSQDMEFINALGFLELIKNA